MNLDFSSSHILVIGDVMLDRYIHGSITRKSPEADVPIILRDSIELKLGGAANVALNIDALSGKSSLISVIGKDKVGKEIRELIADRGAFQTVKLIEEDGRITTSKTRLIADNQHVARIDDENPVDISTLVVDALMDAVKEIVENQNIDLIILQDYNKGVLTERSIEQILRFTQKNNIAVAVDPKAKNFMKYSPCAIFKPNLSELKNAFALDDKMKLSHGQLLEKIQKTLKPEIAIVTLGEKGLLIADKYEQLHVSGLSADEIDVCGAGDAVIAALALAHCEGLSLKEMAKFANAIGFLSCLKIGVYPVKLEEYNLRSSSLNHDIKVQKV